MRVCAAPRVRPSEACHLGPPRGASRQACHAGTSCGASRQACHAGGHVGRATQSPTVRDFQRHPARTTARSTSTRPLSSHLRVLRGLFFSVFSVFSVLLARRFFSAREDFLCRHTCLVAALPRCGLLFCVSSVSSVVCFSPCPPCRVRCGAGFLACGRLSSRPGCPLLTALSAT